jgi:nitric oxide reductase NorQ protein
MTTEPTFRQYAIEEYVVTSEPFYQPVSDEIELFESAYAQRIPVLLKGPTGCGKTRFVEYMAYKLGRPVNVVRESTGNGVSEEVGRPLVTVACHEDLTASTSSGVTCSTRTAPAGSTAP